MTFAVLGGRVGLTRSLGPGALYRNAQNDVRRLRFKAARRRFRFALSVRQGGKNIGRIE